MMRRAVVQKLVVRELFFAKMPRWVINCIHWALVLALQSTQMGGTYNKIQYHAITCSSMQQHTIPCNTMQYHTIPCNIMQYCKKYLQSIQMDAHRWEDPLAWQHCTQSTFYTNLFTFPSIITFSFTFAFNCVFTFKQKSPKVKFSLSLFFHQHRLEEEFPLKTLHAINFSPNFSLALFPITYLPIT